MLLTVAHTKSMEKKHRPPLGPLQSWLANMQQQMVASSPAAALPPPGDALVDAKVVLLALESHRLAAIARWAEEPGHASARGVHDALSGAMVFGSLPSMRPSVVYTMTSPTHTGRWPTTQLRHASLCT